MMSSSFHCLTRITNDASSSVHSGTSKTGMSVFKGNVNALLNSFLGNDELICSN